MSTHPHKLPDENTTGEYEVPAATPSPTESELNSTGAFVLASGGVPERNPNQDPEFDPTTVLPPDDNGTTAVLPPPTPGTVLFQEKNPAPNPSSHAARGKQTRPLTQAESDPTALLPPAALTGGAPENPNDATAEFGTAVYDPPDSDATGVYENGSTDPGATGVYEPDSTQAKGQQDTLKRQQVDPDGTGVYEPGNTGKPGVELGGSTRVLDGANTGTGAGGQDDPCADAHRCGKYVLKRFHAKGGMGEIWMAVDTAIGRSVALKRMLSHRPDQQHRFRVEAQVTGQLEHPGIVPIHELGVNEEGQPFYTMKFVHGETLQKTIDDHHKVKPRAGTGEVAQFRLLQIFLSLCQTVAYAHSKGVLHRDLKPENVMLGPYGETLLLDWGIAKVMDKPQEAASQGNGDGEYVHLVDSSSESETRAGTIMGSLSYMSPEIAQGKATEADQRSDVFLLGGILYAMLAGRPPRQGKNPMELIKQAQSQVPPPPRKFKPEVAKPLDAICMKALALRPEDRYQSALALAQDIQLYSAGEPVSAYREGFLTRAGRWARRHRKALTRTAMAVLFVGLLVSGYIKYRQIEDQRAADKLADKLKVEEADKRTRLAEEEKEKEKRKKEHLQKLDQARLDVKNFRDLTDEARFFAATTDPVAEHAPYFDPHQGETKAKNALAVAASWGPKLEQLLLEEERDPLRKDLYDLRLLVAQTKIQQGTEAAVKEALVLLAEAGQLREKPSRGWYGLRNRALQRLGDEKNAAEDKVIAEAPETAQDHFLRAEQYRKDSEGKEEKDAERKVGQADPKMMGKAIDEYRAALKLDPNDYWAHFQLGRAYMALRKYVEASEVLGACIALRPEAPWGYSVRGLALAQLENRQTDGLSDLKTAVDKSRDDFRPAKLNRGVVLWNLNRNDEALADFAAVLLPPKEKRLLEAAYYRGQLYAQQGKTEQALEDFNRVVAESPALKDVYLYRARIYIAQGQNFRYSVPLTVGGGPLPGLCLAAVENARGLADLTTFLALTNGPTFKRDDWQAYGKRGHLLRFQYLDLPQDQRDKPSGQELISLAVAELKKAVALGGRDTRLFDDLGTMHFHAGHVNEALDAFGKALAITPNDAIVLVERGWLYDALQQRDKAQADFAAACVADPENPEAHYGLGYIRAVQKVPAEAQREADMALVYGSEKYLVMHNVACIYATLAQPGDPQAKAHAEAVIVLLRRAIQLWRRAGTGLNELELIKNEEAFKHLKDMPAFKELIDDHKASAVRWPWSLWYDLPAFKKLTDGDKP